MGKYMRASFYSPALVLCSTALRATETLELLLPHFHDQPEIRYDRALYLADPSQLLAEIHGIENGATPLLLVGHNPGLEQLAVSLALPAGTAPGRGRLKKLAEKFPSGALAVIDFASLNWPQAAPGIGRLKDFVRPKELAGDTAPGK